MGNRIQANTVTSFIDDNGVQCFIDDVGNTTCDATIPPAPGIAGQSGMMRFGGAIYKPVGH